MSMRIAIVHIFLLFSWGYVVASSAHSEQQKNNIPQSLQDSIKNKENNQVKTEIMAYVNENEHALCAVDEQGNSLAMLAIKARKLAVIPALLHKAIGKNTIITWYEIKNKENKTMKDLLEHKGTSDPMSKELLESFDKRLFTVYEMEKSKVKQAQNKPDDEQQTSYQYIPATFAQHITTVPTKNVRDQERKE